METEERKPENSTKKGTIGQWWKNFSNKYPKLSEFIVFFLVSKGVTVFQLLLMPVLKNWFSQGKLVNIAFQIWPIGHNVDGSVYHIFDYAAGTIQSGGGGGLAYFLAVQITLLLAQVINFFAQRNVTFKSNSSVQKAAFWYAVAYFAITISAAALQGLYKAPLYHLLMNRLNLGATGELLADFLSMMINCTVSFWIFFPIMRWIFK